MATKSSVLLAGAKGLDGGTLNQSMSLQNPHNTSQLSGYKIQSSEVDDNITLDEEALLAEYAPYSDKKLSKFKSERLSLLERNMTNQSAVITGLKNRIKQKASDPNQHRLGATPLAKPTSFNSLIQ